MKLSLVYLIFFTTISVRTNHLNQAFAMSPSTHQQETVYICDSKSATKYHSEEDCRGLNNCKADIISIDKKDAIKKGREECGWCY